MAQYNYISLDQVLVGTKITLGLMNNNSYDYALRYFTQEGALHLDNLKVFEPFGAKIYFENGCAELPDNFVSLNSVKSEGGFPFYVNNVEYLKECGCNPDKRWSSAFGLVNIKDGCIEMGVPDGYACISYNGYNTDANGKMMIISIAERALRNYAAGEFGRSKPDMYPQYRDWVAQWIAQKRWLKGNLWQQYIQENKAKIKEWTKCIIADQQNAPAGLWWY